MDVEILVAPPYPLSEEEGFERETELSDDALILPRIVTFIVSIVWDIGTSFIRRVAFSHSPQIIDPDDFIDLMLDIEAAISSPVTRINLPPCGMVEVYAVKVIDGIIVDDDLAEELTYDTITAFLTEELDDL